MGLVTGRAYVIQPVTVNVVLILSNNWV